MQLPEKDKSPFIVLIVICLCAVVVSAQLVQNGNDRENARKELLEEKSKRELVEVKLDVTIERISKVEAQVGNAKTLQEIKESLERIEGKSKK